MHDETSFYQSIAKNKRTIYGARYESKEITK